MGYVYRHVRKDTNEVFYIGIGLKEDPEYKRAYDKFNGRNRMWKGITAKTEYEVHIMMDDLTDEETIAKEIELISLYGRRDLGTGTLANMTSGGEGSRGRIISDEQREKMRGRKHSDEARRKMSERQMGELNHNYGKKESPEAKEKNRASNTGRKHSDETKKKMREAQLGELNHRYGKVPAGAKLVLDKQTGIFYNSALEAYRELNLKMSSAHFTSMLSGAYPNKTSCIYA
jgi:hypothetical protein